MIVLTSLTAALAVFLFVLWYVRSKGEMEVRVRALGEQQRLVVEYQDPFSQRVAFPVVDGLVHGLMAILPTSLVGRSRRWLVTAGDTMELSQFMTIVLVTATLLPALVFVLAAAAAGGMPGGYALLFVVGVAIFGFSAPFLLLRSRAKARQKKIWRSMPSTLDLMTTCVEAGLSLDFALQRVADRYKGPLSDEVQRALREIGLGKTRREAMGDMAERVDLPDLHTFVNSMAQAEQLGTSIASVLRVQAKQMRMKRRQAAEQVARRAPVKMVFPLVFFFIPSLFIVILGPIALHAWQGLTN